MDIIINNSKVFSLTDSSISLEDFLSIADKLRGFLDEGSVATVPASTPAPAEGWQLKKDILAMRKANINYNDIYEKLHLKARGITYYKFRQICNGEPTKEEKIKERIKERERTKLKKEQAEPKRRRRRKNKNQGIVAKVVDKEERQKSKEEEQVLMQKIYDMRSAGQSFSDISHTFDLSNSDTRRLWARMNMKIKKASQEQPATISDIKTAFEDAGFVQVPVPASADTATLAPPATLSPATKMINGKLHYWNGNEFVEVKEQ